VCKELWANEDLKAEARRLRRELGDDEENWETWFSVAQQKAIRELKSKGASHKTVMAKVMKFSGYRFKFLLIRNFENSIFQICVLIPTNFVD
jgi:hypothetical protein